MKARNPIALLAAIAATAASAQTAPEEPLQLFQEVEGAYMMNVRKAAGIECQIAQFTGPGVTMLMIAQTGSGDSYVSIFTPINPNAPSFRQNIRLELSAAAAKFDLDVDMEIKPHPNTADHWVLSGKISPNEATAVLISERVTVKTSEGSFLATIAAPSTLKAEAMRAYNACKATH